MTASNDPREHDVELTLGSSSAALDVWDEYAITLDLTAPGSPFTFAVWRSETRRTTWDTLRRTVKCMDSAVLKIDGAQQLNGRIERIETSADGHGEARMVISGRDLAGPAMDWDADPTTSVNGLTLEMALRRVFEDVGLPLRVTTADAAREVTTRRRGGASATAIEASASSAPASPLSPALSVALSETARLPSVWEAERASERVVSLTSLADLRALPLRTAARARARAIKDIIIPTAHPRPGERVWAFAESICARVGVLMWVAPDADGGMMIVVDTPANDAPPTYAFARLVRGIEGDPGNNILALAETIDTRTVPTTVSVYTGSSRGDNVSARQRSEVINAQLSSRAINRGLVVAEPPPQPRHMRSTRAKTLARAGREGQRVIVDAMRSFRTVSLVVRGHGQLVGGVPTLYAVNTIARVYDSVCTDSGGAPLDEEMLITRVTFKRTRSAGTTTELQLAPRGALYLEPEDG